MNGQGSRQDLNAAGQPADHLLQEIDDLLVDLSPANDIDLVRNVFGQFGRLVQDEIQVPAFVSQKAQPVHGGSASSFWTAIHVAGSIPDTSKAAVYGRLSRLHPTSSSHTAELQLHPLAVEVITTVRHAVGALKNGKLLVVGNRPSVVFALSQSASVSTEPQFNWLRSLIKSDDLHFDHVRGTFTRRPVRVAYVKTMVDQERLAVEVLSPLQTNTRSNESDGDPRKSLAHAEWTANKQTIVKRILEGYVALFQPGQCDAYLVEAKWQKTRAVSKPTTEVQLLGPKAAFTEDLDTNLGLIRQLVRTARCQVKMYELGALSKTPVAVVFLDGISNKQVVVQVTNALSKINVDYVRDSVDLQELLTGRSLTPFPLAQKTERPDRVVAGLASGRVSIIVNGSPFALLVPVTLNELHKDSELFLSGGVAKTFVRWLRYVGVLLSMIVPGLYAAVMAVNPEVLPPDILITVSIAREGIPYPILYEVLVMLAILDVVTEATIQAPSPIGQTLTIVGSLIVGQAAVQAHLASQLMVIVLAVSAIGSLLAVNVPLGYAIRLAKYPITIAAGILGFYGLLLALVGLTVHLASLKSFGVPYLAPLGPMRWRDIRLYSIFSAAKQERTRRPVTFAPEDVLREGANSP